MYGSACSGSPVGPTVPTVSPSARTAPLATASEPRWVSVTSRPPAVAIVTLNPEAGTEPAKVTDPADGARTGAPAAAPTSMPRC